MNPAIQPADWAMRPLPTQGGSEAAAVVVLTGEPQVGWSLQRRCSLTPGQFGAALTAAATLSLAVGAFFWAAGVAWVAVFSGVELAGVAAAFLWHALHAADGERLSLYPHGLYVECRSGLRWQRHWLARHGLRVVMAADGDLQLRSHRGRLSLGRHATLAARRRVAFELRQALDAGAAH